MKRFVVMALITVLILALASPVCALNDQPNFDRENYFYARAEWTIGEPFGEEPYEIIEFEIGRHNSKLEDFILQLRTSTFDGSVYTILSYYVYIPETKFTFPKKLDSGIALNLQTQGTQYGYSYELDENFEQINIQTWEEPAEYDFDLAWTRDNHCREFINNHFAMNFSEDPAELTDLVYKSKDEQVNGSVSGTVNQHELSEGVGVYGISTEKIPIVYMEPNETALADSQILPQNGSNDRYNDFLDLSDLGGYWLLPIGDDPEIAKPVYISIGMHDKRTKTWILNINEDILNENNEVSGWRLFVAEIPDSAFAFPKDSPGTIVLDLHVTGTKYDYYYGEDEEEMPEPIITENIEHNIQSTWNLMITQSSKAIRKYSDDYSKTMEIQQIAYFNGTVNLILDDLDLGEGTAWGSLWLNHTIGN